MFSTGGGRLYREKRIYYNGEVLVSAAKTTRGGEHNDNFRHDGEILGGGDKTDQRQAHHDSDRHHSAVRWEAGSGLRHDGEERPVGHRGISRRRRSDKSFGRLEQGPG